VNAFIVQLDNKTGELARVTEAIAQRGIDLTGFSGATCGESGSIALMTNDEAGTRKVLADTHLTVREIEVVPASIDAKPGGLAAVARKLADAGVNIEAAMATGMSGDRVTVAFATSDAAKARAALGEAAMSSATR
jgi:hypothetical protein